VQKYQDVVLDHDGNIVTTATVAVAVHGGGAATIYSDNGVTPKANPFPVSSIDGSFSFYAANGRYDIVVPAAGLFLGKTFSDVTLFDDVDFGGVGDGDKGDVVVSGDGHVWTVDNDAVTYAKMQNVSATSRLIGRVTAGAGDPEEVVLDNDTALAADSATRVATQHAVKTYVDTHAAPAATRWIGFYNGQAGSGYNIGRCWSADGIYFSKDREAADAFIDPAELVGTGFTYTNLLSPQPVLVGSLIYLYYEGFESGGSTYNIRLMILDTDGRYVGTAIPPIIVPGGGGFMNHSVRRPCVMYEPTDATWPFKMIFAAGSASINPDGLGYARSADGITWTVVGKVVSLGAAASWDDGAIEAHSFRNRSGTYEIVYGGAADAGSDPANWQIGVATAADPAGVWTKYASNPVIPHRTSAETTLTANTAVRDRQITVTSTAQFLAGDIVTLWDTSGAGSNEHHVVKTINDATHLTFYEPIAGAYSTAATAKITAIDKNSVDPGFMWYDSANDRLVMHVTGFQHITGRLREYDMVFTVAGNNPATTSWTRFPHTRLPLAMSQKSTSFDKDSAENLSAVKVS
jgi:hypothetical protein